MRGREDREADVAVAVDVLVDRDSLRGPNKCHLGRVKGILGVELELHHELLAIVEGVHRPEHLDSPHPEIRPGQCLLIQLEAGRGTGDEALELLLESLKSGPGDFLRGAVSLHLLPGCRARVDLS